MTPEDRELNAQVSKIIAAHGYVEDDYGKLHTMVRDAFRQGRIDGMETAQAIIQGIDAVSFSMKVT